MADGSFQGGMSGIGDVEIKRSRYTVLVPLRGGRHLAYNTISGAFAIWDARDHALWGALGRAKSVPFEPDYRCFVQGGFVVNADLDEREDLRQSYEARRYDDSTMMLTIAPTLSCNFACAYCFQGLNKPAAHMASEVRAATLNFLRTRLDGLRNLHVTWYGGEPLMDQGSIREISKVAIDHCDAMGIRYGASIITNGYHLTPPVAEMLAKARVKKVQITIDGDAESHDARRHLVSGRGTFDRIMKNIRWVAERGLMKISIRINLDGENEPRALGLLEALQQAGLGIRNGVSVYFAPVEGMAEAADAPGCGGCFSKTEYAEAETRLGQLAFEKGLMGVPKMPKFLGLCTAVRPNSYVVVPNGDLHKCWDTVMDPTKRVGSVLSPATAIDAGTEILWNGWSPFDNHVCTDCMLLPACAGACAFKFVHNDYASGEAAKLPCPSLKFNMAELLFQRAKARGHVSDEDWDPDASPTVGPDGLLTGSRHTFSSVDAIYHWLRDMHPLPG